MATTVVERRPVELDLVPARHEETAFAACPPVRWTCLLLPSRQTGSSRRRCDHAGHVRRCAMVRGAPRLAAHFLGEVRTGASPEDGVCGQAR